MGLLVFTDSTSCTIYCHHPQSGLFVSVRNVVVEGKTISSLNNAIDVLLKLDTFLPVQNLEDPIGRFLGGYNFEDVGLEHIQHPLARLESDRSCMAIQPTGQQAVPRSVAIGAVTQKFFRRSKCHIRRRNYLFSLGSAHRRLWF